MAKRLFASLVAVWFGFVTIQPLYASPCPHHEPALAALAQGFGVSGGSPVRPSHGTHGTHGSLVHDGGGGSDDGNHGSHGCHCVGACCGAAPVAVASPTDQSVPSMLAEQIAVPKSPPIVRAPETAAPHTHPFATAPPIAVLV